MNNEFTEPTDELKRVAEEINLLRKDIQTASAALGRIERRLKAAFPNYPSQPKKAKEKKQTGKIISSKKSHELLAISDDLVSRTQGGDDSAFAERMTEFNDEDIVALAVELGMGSRSRLSRQKALDGIRKRVQESLQPQFENKTNLQQANQPDRE